MQNSLCSNNAVSRTESIKQAPNDTTNYLVLVLCENYTQVYVKNSFEAAKTYCNAFQILSDGGVIIEPIGELPWSRCCATIIDKFGVCWWISI